MTDEAREKIIQIQRRHVNANIWAEENADEILKALHELGYRLIPEKLEGLTDEEMKKVLYDASPKGFNWSERGETEKAQDKVISQATVEKIAKQLGA